MVDLLSRVKENLIIDHDEDDSLLQSFILAAVDYAERYQKIPRGYYLNNVMPESTSQAVVMLVTHFYESRDGSSAGFFDGSTQGAEQVWQTVNLLLSMDKDWKV